MYFRKKIYEELVDGKDFDFITHKQVEVQFLLKSKKIESENDYIEKLKKNLLECDRRRANLDSYDENILFDPNRGHWDLWDWNEDKETTGEIILDEGFTARNPVDDINHGIVGIDFGTKALLLFMKMNIYRLCHFKLVVVIIAKVYNRRIMKILQ